MRVQNRPSWAALIFYVLTASALARESALDIAIPPQDLASAIETLSRQTGLQVLSDGAALHGKKTQGVAGHYTVRDALPKLLAGTGLSHAFTAEDSVSIMTAEQTPPPSPPGASDSERDQGQGVTALEEMTVTASPFGETSYSVPNATTATKTDTPIMETPVSIQVIPRTVLDDQQAITLADGLKNVSGVQWSPVVGGLYENFVVRGFDADGATYRDGLREEAFAAETANVERLEVLKGPAAILYGRIEPGGLINRVTKQPLGAPYYSLQQQFGSFEFYRTTLDATGPFTQDQSLAYRFNLAYQDNNSFRDFIFRDRIFVAPVLTWRPSDRTDIGIAFEYQRDDLRWDDGFPVQDGANRPVSLPINRSLSDPITKDSQERELIYAHWSHKFDPDWKLTHRFSTYLANYDQFHVFPFGFQSDNRTLNQHLWNVQQERDTYATNLDLTGRVETWGAQHSLLFGFDFYRLDQEAPGQCCAQVSSIDIFNPVYGNLDEAALRALPNNFFSVDRQTWYGAYFQDQIKLLDKLHILGGGRYDWATAGTGFSGESLALADSGLNATEIESEKFSPRVGILYQPWQWASVYANYTESLGANGGRNADNRPLPPEEAHQYEAGMKTELLNGRLTSTLAFFEVTKTNVATADPDPARALQGFRLTIGEARSRGIELDVAGQLTDSWSVIANYAYTYTRITKDNNGLEGNRLPNVPLNSANLWTKYEFNTGPMSGLSLGTGLRVVSQRQGDPQNDFQLPGFVTWDAALAYKLKLGPSRLTAQFNVNNILDKRYFAGADTFDASQRFYGNLPGAPLNFIGSLRLEF